MKNIRPLMMFLILFLATSSAYAFEMPTIDFFEPFPNDLSRWYLGNIFGSDLVPGSNVPNIQLMGKLFGIFNQVALVVTIIIVSYTVFAGALNTAAEGKALGEKWNAVWMPIRIVVGIALLVPKAGTGYCLAQYIVMWLILMGIGAADTVWGKMIDYFEAGGAIAVNSVEDKPLTFSYDNMNYTYALQTDQSIGGGAYGGPKTQPADIMKSMVCVEAYNNDPAHADVPKYKAYLGSTLAGDVPSHPILMFGDQKQFNANNPINDNQTGAECGYIKYVVNDELSKGEKAKEPERAAIYMNGLLIMANSLDKLAKTIVTTTDLDDADTFPKQYTDVQRAMQLYVHYITSYRNTLAPVRKTAGSLKLYKEFGWILAGNYYTVLSNYREQAMMQEQQFVLPVNHFEYKGPINKDDPNGYYPRASSFYTTNYFTGSPDPMYTVPGSEYMVEQEANQPATGSTISPIDRSKTDKLSNAVKRGFNKDEVLSGESKKRVDEFIKYLTGEGRTGLSSQNPIMHAARYGKSLTEGAVAMMIIFGTLWTAATSWAATLSGTLPFKGALYIFLDIVTPMMLALGGFMYAQGAVLGIFIPLIPYVTFLTGVIGYMLAVVESIAAAPLVCMGLIFPETKDEIWGRAAPAYMLVLNLFLRPSMMIIGFAAAMVLMWIMTEIINIGFLTLVAATFRIENMFGFVSILTVYTTVFTYIVTEVYSLINVVPNRVLAWIGDQSMGVKGAKEALGAAKQGAEAGAAAAVGGMEASSKADMWRAEEHLRERDIDNEASVRLGKDANDPKAREEMKKKIRAERDGGMTDAEKANAAAAQHKPPGG